MITDAIKRQAIQTGCEVLGNKKYVSKKASVFMAAIAYQESNFEHRAQIGGSAKGFWQFEKGGGVLGVMTHEAVTDDAHLACCRRNVIATIDKAYKALEFDDVLAAAFARLLLWTSPKPLPTLKMEAWDYYLSVWRPGKPHLERWERNWNLGRALYEGI